MPKKDSTPKSKSTPQCTAIQASNGQRCRAACKPNSEFCGKHRTWHLRDKQPSPKAQCIATVKLGHKCTRHATDGTAFCAQHLQKSQQTLGSQEKAKGSRFSCFLTCIGRSPPAPSSGPAQNTRSKAHLSEQEEKHLGIMVLQRCKDAEAGTLRALMTIIYSGPSISDSTAKQGWIYMYKLQQGQSNQFKVGSHHGRRGEDRVAEWERRCGYKAEVVATWPALFASAAESLICTELQGRGLWMGFLKKCNCGSRHREWFKGEVKVIQAVISHWVDYVCANAWLSNQPGSPELRSYPRTLLPST
uniref:Bacteriophage T5 Orf172 DNA-binding domain-containing protein n=1 Tax=Dunaliella tertiolecta TaxID=3047 RepID=A0A7S3VIH1_DUNTE|mmetsp:Transcript_13121/g.35723  ORF Transcript_13121/g.35723 Transcript_13121/m.35723 type:complete len:303 (+) Transcript_13121:136-1044(+)|eukprot:CAMPEP_0202419236 /NCGR_PEP_ID=MMETSP1128-20130828/48793_1 /ASSEMBLY_ACC=CAM_ASM_000463 /TAXON_ID=3047 /ORGANISM="Dunaliella tertiolecta, Strain CCMP1320" /LENGTH=302 /DNA_ID=CAMNT_0049027129 /DNA_START=50 /DNA_END=958 /DNA_ORIENTATION=-